MVVSSGLSSASSKSSSSHEVAKPSQQVEILETSLLPHSKRQATFALADSKTHPFKPIAGYEGIHRYDPDFQWDKKEEKKLVRKVCHLDELLVKKGWLKLDHRLMLESAAGYASCSSPCSLTAGIYNRLFQTICLEISNSRRTTTIRDKQSFTSASSSQNFHRS